MRFHQFKQHLKTIGSFSNSLMKIGSIDLQELKKCLENLQLLNLKELEVEVGGFSSMSSLSSSASSIFRHSHHLLPLQTIDNYGPMQTSKMGSSELEATFDTIVEVFLLHDKIGDGKFNKKDLVNTLNDAPSQNSVSRNN
ncbi:unnamed protein product [Linum trigynum]|uniref:EF-hand domain-containing protein n=1 Tax=Linum trigynum TaxID=586398 RepID=A0AAV2CDJ2_9ROSI